MKAQQVLEKWENIKGKFSNKIEEQKKIFDIMSFIAGNFWVKQIFLEEITTLSDEKFQKRQQDMWLLLEILQLRKKLVVINWILGKAYDFGKIILNKENIEVRETIQQAEQLQTRLEKLKEEITIDEQEEFDIIKELEKNKATNHALQFLSKLMEIKKIFNNRLIGEKLLLKFLQIHNFLEEDDHPCGDNPKVSLDFLTKETTFQILLKEVKELLEKVDFSLLEIIDKFDEAYQEINQKDLAKLKKREEVRKVQEFFEYFFEKGYIFLGKKELKLTLSILESDSENSDSEDDNEDSI